jgi:hypothetical protein
MTILAGDRWRIARSSACALLVAGLAYGPFVLSGHFELLRHVWLIHPGSLVHLVLPGRTRFGWSLRLVQGALSALACGVVAYRGRGNPEAQWLAPLAGVAVRILADPGALDYYWLPAGALVVGGIATIGRRRTKVQLAGVALLGYVTYAATTLVSAPLLTGAGCFVGVALALYSRPAHSRSRLASSWRRSRSTQTAGGPVRVRATPSGPGQPIRMPVMPPSTPSKVPVVDAESGLAR